MGDLGSIPGLGRSPGEGKGYPLQYPDLEKSMGCIVHGVTKSRTQLGDFNFHLINHNPTIQSSHSVVSNSLQPHGLQHAMLPYPSPTPRAGSNSCPLSQWYYPTIASPVIPFSFCPQSFPTSGSFPMCWFFSSGGQRTGASASASVLPTNIQDWFLLGWTGWISLQSKGLSRVFSSTTVQNHQFFGAQLSLWSNSHIHSWPLEKPQLWLDGPLSAK